ncbi:hypothetical protein D3C80_1628260 [compost metagenome]
MGVVILHGQVLGDFPVATGEVELIALARTTQGRQAGLIAGAPTGGVFDPPTDQGQVLELARAQLAAFEGLRQQAAVVRDQDWQLRQQRAQAQFGFRNSGFSGQAQAAPLIHGVVVAV